MKSLRQTLKESKKRNDNEIEFENVPAGLRFQLYKNGMGIGTYSGGNGFGSGARDSWKSTEYEKMYDEEDWSGINSLKSKVIRDLLPVCDRFDKELESVMKKHGFKK